MPLAARARATAAVASGSDGAPGAPVPKPPSAFWRCWSQAPNAETALRSAGELTLLAWIASTARAEVSVSGDRRAEGRPGAGGSVVAQPADRADDRVADRQAHVRVVTHPFQRERRQRRGACVGRHEAGGLPGKPPGVGTDPHLPAQHGVDERLDLVALGRRRRRRTSWTVGSTSRNSAVSPVEPRTPRLPLSES